MSKLPKPPAKLPAPKALSKKATASEEHDRLLRLLWDKAEALAAVLYIGHARQVAARAKESWREGLVTLANAAKEVQAWRDECQDAAVLSVLTSVGKQIAFLRKADMPEVPVDLYIPIVEKTVLAAPIKDDPVLPSSKTVGYIGYP